MAIPLNEVKKSLNHYHEFDVYSDFKYIGSGGSGKVYSVRRKNRLYAMKIPIMFDPSDMEKTLCDISEDVREKVESEIEYLAELTEKCPDAVVNLEDFGMVPWPWLVMELANTDFRKAMDAGEADVADITDLLYKLDRIHRAGFNHLDIKPENIMKVGMEWKFTDLGLSNPINSISKSLSRSRYVGTYQYSAPEQISPKIYGKKDHTTDIWQMGIICYEILSGRQPYDTDDFMELVDMIKDGGPDLRHVPEEYRGALSKAFSVKKENRYKTAREFAQALILAGSDGKVSYPSNTGELSNKDLEPNKGMAEDPYPKGEDASENRYNEKPLRVASQSISYTYPRKTNVEEKNQNDHADGNETSSGDHIKESSSTEASVTKSKQSGKTTKALKDAHQSAKSLMKAGHSVSDLLDEGYTAKDLRSEGVSARDLRNAGCSLMDLKDAGFSINNLKDAGYSALSLKNAGYRLKDLTTAGFGVKDFLYVGYPLEDLITAGFKSRDFRDAGYPLKDLKDSGFSIKDLKDSGYSASDFKEAGYNSMDILTAGFTAKDLKDAGFTAKDLKDSGYSALSLKDAGYGLRVIIAAGFMSRDFMDAGYSLKDLMDAQQTVKRLRDMGYSLDDFLDEGYTAKDLSLEGVSARDLRNAGCPLKDLMDAGFTAKDLKEAGYPAKDLRDANYLVKDLITAGFTTRELKNAGYTARDLKNEGYSKKDLKMAGYSKEELRGAGFFVL